MDLVETARLYPDRPAVIFEGHRTSYRELDELATAAAARLAALGVAPGDRVALWLPNRPSFVAWMYGIWRAGAAVVPVHEMLTVPETRHILSNSGARVLVCSQRHADASVPELISSVEALEHVIVPEREEDAAQDGFEPVVREPGSLALVAYTSGTSGLPKGAMLTDANLRANIEQMKRIPVATRPGDVVLSILPLFHIYGLNVVVNLSVDVGATIVLQERFDPAATAELIREHEVTVVAGAPPAYVAWLGLPPEFGRAHWESVRVAASGAAPLPREVLEGFQQRFGVTIWEGYGLTETSPTLTSTSVGGQPKPGSVGRPVPDVELRLMAPDGMEAEEGDPGEIVVRGPNVFGGYWEDPEATEAAFVDGWFRTGDVAILDDDGDLYLVDRKRDLILVSGFNVYPKEVEDAIVAHPDVVDCAVVGISDPYHGEAVKAIVALRPGAELDQQQLVAHAAAHLAPYKVPRTVEFVSDIPRNAAGKVLRRALR
ncbi:MAG TPA: long-chain fatty acid--CoA ligase [Actinomycetota bacterium]|nr:long-chain fatty acid--CoA ligase [Actinomycetota bacterium]